MFSRIRTEYGDLLCKSPISARMRKVRFRKTQNTDIFYAVYVLCSCLGSQTGSLFGLLSCFFIWKHFERALSGLRQLLATEGPLKMINNAFYFTLKALLGLKISNFLSWLFTHVEKRLEHLQYTYWPIFQEVKAIRQWNLVSW